MTTLTTGVQADLPVALHALTGHIVAHRLPAPQDLSLPHQMQSHLVVWIRRDHLAAWEAADFTVINKAEHPLRHDPALGQRPWARTVVDGHLATPIGDLALQLVYIAPATTTVPMLSVVS